MVERRSSCDKQTSSEIEEVHLIFMIIIRIIAPITTILFVLLIKQKKRVHKRNSPKFDINVWILVCRS